MSITPQSDPRPLLALLSIVAQREREAMVEAMAARGFDGVSLPVVRLLDKLTEQPRSVQALAGVTGTTKQFCGREVKRLEALGYLTVKPSAEDRRVTLVSLRIRGRRLLAAMQDAKRELDATVIRRLGADDANVLRRLLSTLAESAPASGSDGE